PSPAGAGDPNTAEARTDRGAAKAPTDETGADCGAANAADPAADETGTDCGAAKAADPAAADAGADCSAAKAAAAADPAAGEAGTLGKCLVRQQTHPHQTRCCNEPKLFHGRLLCRTDRRGRAPGASWSMIFSENRYPLFGIML